MVSPITADRTVRLALVEVAMLVPALLGGCAGAASPPARTAPWVHPEQRFEIAFPAEPSTRVAQELHGMGAINFTVYAVDDEQGAAYRAYAFDYPGEVPGLTHFDPEGELEHSVGVQVARMTGTMQNDVRISAEGLIGREVVFGVTNEAGVPGRGILRMFLRASPPARYQAWCLGPETAFDECLAFVRSLRPNATR